MTGVGSVNASSYLTWFIKDRKVNSLSDYIVLNVGYCGTLDRTIKKGEAYPVKKAIRDFYLPEIFKDFDRSLLVSEFIAPPDALTCYTSDRFIEEGPYADRARGFGCQVCDMEAGVLGAVTRMWIDRGFTDQICIKYVSDELSAEDCNKEYEPAQYARGQYREKVLKVFSRVLTNI